MLTAVNLAHRRRIRYSNWVQGWSLDQVSKCTRNRVLFAQNNRHVAIKSIYVCIYGLKQACGSLTLMIRTTLHNYYRCNVDIIWNVPLTSVVWIAAKLIDDTALSIAENTISLMLTKMSFSNQPSQESWDLWYSAQTVMCQSNMFSPE